MSYLASLPETLLAVWSSFKRQPTSDGNTPTGVLELVDGGTWNTIAGQLTDDSEMALLLAQNQDQRMTGCRYRHQPDRRTRGTLMVLWRQKWSVHLQFIVMLEFSNLTAARNRRIIKQVAYGEPDMTKTGHSIGVARFCCL